MPATSPPRAGAYELVRLLPEDPRLDAARELLNAALGAGYVGPDDLPQLIEEPDWTVLAALDAHGRVVGAATGGVLSVEEAESLTGTLVAAGVRHIDLRVTRVGLLESAAVTPGHRGRGLGGRLVAERLAFLRERGCTSVVALAWLSGSPQSSLPVLTRAGFAPVVQLPDYWYCPDGDAGYECAKCGLVCRCAAVFLHRFL